MFIYYIFDVFSVYSLNYQQSFTLESTTSDKYPTNRSIESFVGRKCFEFIWKDGDPSACIGLSDAHSGSKVFIMGTDYFVFRGSSGVSSSIFTNLSIRIEKNKRYMVCFDMHINKLILIYHNNTYVYDHYYSHNSKWNILIMQGSNTY